MRLGCHRIVVGIAACVGISALASAPSTAFALKADLVQSHRFFLQYLPQALDASAVRHPWVTSQEGLHRREYQLHLRARLKGRPLDSLGLRLGLDTGLLSLSSEGARIDGRDIDRAIIETGLLGETHAEWQLGTAGFVMVRMGKLRPEVAGGAIYDAYALGVMVDVDLSYLDAPPDIFMRAHLLLPDASFTARLKRSPLLNFEAGWTGQGRSKVVLMGAAFFDNDGALEPLFADAIARDSLLRVASALDARTQAIAQPRLRTQAQALRDEVVQGLVGRYNAGDRIVQQTTSGTAGWLGIMGAFEQGPWLMRGRALLGLGLISSDGRATDDVQSFLQDSLARLPNQGQGVIDVLDSQGDVPLLSYFLSLDADLKLTDDVRAQAFGLLVSGDDRLSLDSQDSYSAFVSIAPLLPYTSIFFRGAAATRLSSPTTASLAPDAAGVIGGGLGLSAWFAALRLRVVAAALGSQVRSAFAEGQFYGAEVNLGLSGALGRYFVLSGDVALFVPGSYFGDGVPVAVQAFATVTAHFPDL